MRYTKYERAAAAVAVIAALADAAVQLNSLEMLTVTNVPDVWKLGFQQMSAAARAAEAAVLNTMVAETCASYNFQELPTITEAATTLATLDDCGCWLLQQHTALQKVQISTANCQCTMTWRQQQQQQQQRRVFTTGVTSSTAAAESSAPQSSVQPISITSQSRSLLNQRLTLTPLLPTLAAIVTAATATAGLVIQICQYPHSSPNSYLTTAPA